MMTSNAIVASETSNTYSSIIALQIHSENGNKLLLIPSCKYQSEATIKYHSEMDASSYDSYTNSLNCSSLEITFEEIMSKLHTKITDSQEDLGSEFKSVYFKNAWNLYEN